MNAGSLLRALGAVGLLGLSSVALADNYEIDAAHSTAIFAAKHFNVSWTYGRFNDISGKVVWDADPAKSSVDITVKTDSLDTNVDKRDQHLKSPDFFNSAQFPTMTFKSKSITKKSGNTFSVTGDLTIHGVTKSVTTDFEYVGTGPDAWGGTRSGYTTALTVKRADYGMSNMPDAVGPDVKLIISLEGVKK